MKFEKLVVATRNPSKVDYYGNILAQFANQVLGLNDLSIEGKPEEAGQTAEENAEIKARFYTERAHLPVFSEDETLETDFLSEDQQPGTHVRRINGRDEVSDDELLEHWKKLIALAPENKRTGRWHIAYSLATPDGKIVTVSRDHEILFFQTPSAKRISGWPLSSLQGSIRFKKPSVDQTPEEKEQGKKLVAEEIAKAFEELVSKSA